MPIVSEDRVGAIYGCSESRVGGDRVRVLCWCSGGRVGSWGYGEGDI